MVGLGRAFFIRQTTRQLCTVLGLELDYGRFVINQSIIIKYNNFVLTVAVLLFKKSFSDIFLRRII